MIDIQTHYNIEENTVKIILLESVNHLGRSGDVVDVKPGFARNYLIPNGFALAANKDNMAVLEAKQSEINAKEAEKRKAAEALKTELEKLTLSLKVETNDEGHLFGAVGVPEVAKLLSGEGHEIVKRDIVLPSGPITELGEYTVEVVCHVDITAKITLNVIK